MLRVKGSANDLREVARQSQDIETPGGSVSPFARANVDFVTQSTASNISQSLPPKPGRHKKMQPRRRKLTTVAAVTAFVLLVVAASALVLSERRGDGDARSSDAPSWAPSQASTLGRRSSWATDIPTVVPFSAPGLLLPLDQALDLKLAIHDEEKYLFMDMFMERSSSSPLTTASMSKIASPADAEGNKHSKDRPTALPVSVDTIEATDGNPAAILAAGMETNQLTSLPIQQHTREGEDIRLLVAVVSACCDDMSMQRRAAIRATWAALARERYLPSTVDVQFFLSQAPNSDALRRALPSIAAEVRDYNDTVILREADVYRNLYRKTGRMLRYALAHPDNYTHVLKCDDDTWVRVHRVFDILQGPAVAFEGHITDPWADLKARVAERGRNKGKLVTTDTMVTHDASRVFAEHGAAGVLDDLDGSQTTFGELAGRAGILAAGQSLGGATNAAGIQNVEDVQKWKGPIDNALDSNDQPADGSVADKLLHEKPRPPRMTGVYIGCVEITAGFLPIRDPSSKWYISEEDLPDQEVPWRVQYAAGWGYVLSRDVVGHVVAKLNAYEAKPYDAPRWFHALPWEDVQVGVLLSDVTKPESHPAFRPAWRMCSPNTAVRHLDTDSPRLLAGLVEQDRSGLADEKPVQCSSGKFLPGDYAGWKEWKDELASAKEM